MMEWWHVGALALGVLYALLLWMLVRELRQRHRERRDTVQRIRSRGRLVRIPDSPGGRQRFEFLADDEGVPLAKVEPPAAWPEPPGARSFRPAPPTARPEGPSPQPPPGGGGSA